VGAVVFEDDYDSEFRCEGRPLPALQGDRSLRAALHAAVLADFVAEGHFGRHLRRMRTLYTGRREALRDGLERKLGGAVTIVGAPAGLDLALRFREPLDDVALTAALAEAGVSAEPLSALHARAPRASGLLLGFSAVSERRIGVGVATLARTLEAMARR
jgi:GntR family transcriptional regulator / MocR family aminotransferase